LYGTSTVQSIDVPLSAVTASGAHHALIEPFVTAIGHSSARDRSRSIERPLPTVDMSNRYGLVEPLLVEYHGNSTPYPVSLPVKTITTKDRFALLEPLLTDFRFSNKPYPVSNPLGSLVTKTHIGLLEPVINPRLDIRFRMLKNHELKKAQGFPDDYVITGNTTEQTKQIGNAVPVNTAKALALAVMGK
ncbi:MAG: DNA cytosine methyltransferase, partial [Treponema sp.]|nr:DNA cytosine methyltransferase [Treponema sp.]